MHGCWKLGNDWHGLLAWVNAGVCWLSKLNLRQRHFQVLLVQGSVAGNAHAQARNRGVQADEEAGAGPSLEQAEQLEPSLNGPLASLAGRSYSDAGADQDISSPKRQPAVSSPHQRAEAHGDGHLEP